VHIKKLAACIKYIFIFVCVPVLTICIEIGFILMREQRTTSSRVAIIISI
jgi:hypothetical protein